MEGLDTAKKINPEKAKEYEEILWQRAQEFSIVRQALQQRLDELSKLFEEKLLSSLNLYEREIRGKEESEYWKIEKEIERIKQEEDKLEKVLTDLNSGIANKEEIESLIPIQNEEERQMSKRKKRILEEKQKSGTDPRGIMDEMYGEFGTEKMHLTTGRHATSVKNLGISGMADPLTVATEFYYRTTDTHGGKVDYGKHGNTYVSLSGKRIRKK